MGCGCNGNKNSASTTWTYVPADGSAPRSYSTEVEARAAQIRAGGTGSVQPG